MQGSLEKRTLNTHEKHQNNLNATLNQNATAQHVRDVKKKSKYKTVIRQREYSKTLVNKHKGTN